VNDWATPPPSDLELDFLIESMGIDPAELAREIADGLWDDLVEDG
jgi:hypothetical protein